MSKRNLVVVDVRNDLRRGLDPVVKTMRAVANLRPSEDFLLIAPFDPVPLFGSLAQRGFSYTSRCTDSGDYEALFTREPRAKDLSERMAAPARSEEPETTAYSESPILESDARELEPSQPLVSHR